MVPVLTLFLIVLAASPAFSYRAAVAQHVVIEGKTPQETLDLNMMAYQKHVEMASKENVDIIVFPELGLGGNLDSREAVFPYLEDIPEMSETEIVNPCLNPGNYPVTSNSSCWARSFNMTIATQLYDVKYCDRSVDVNCPNDGKYHYIVEVVFGPDGAMIAKYRKYHVWFIQAFDIPEPTLVTFKSSFGVEFGVFVCFDILFPSPPKDLINKGIKHFVFSVAMNFILGKEVHRVWSENNNAVLLSSNVGQRWSGIFDSGNELNSKKVSIPGYSKDSILVADVPV